MFLTCRGVMVLRVLNGVTVKPESRVEQAKNNENTTTCEKHGNHSSFMLSKMYILEYLHQKFLSCVRTMVHHTQPSCTKSVLYPRI